jgi:hypothetical protein
VFKKHNPAISLAALMRQTVDFTLTLAGACDVTRSATDDTYSPISASHPAAENPTHLANCGQAARKWWKSGSEPNDLKNMHGIY